jgi:rSAM/selenodomain-associated transferase 2/rSAM/selenodomain-associated transferase 1
MMIFDPDSSILVVFCRRPMIGVGKQRIAADLGKGPACEIAKLLLAATLEDASVWPGPVVLSPAQSEDENWAAGLLPTASVIAQPPGNLGLRIQHVQTQIRNQGGRRIIFIGSDSPGLTQQHLEDAFAKLEHTDSVFIPARDGGVTLMGSRLPWPNLADLPWETPELGHALQRRCQTAGLGISTMQTGSDIDTRQDLIDAVDLLADDRRSTRVDLREWILASGLGTNASATKELCISVIIPVFNDLAALEILLQRFSNAQPESGEVIVVDGNNSQDCLRLCRQHAAIYIAAQPNRGAQLSLGAKHATGDVLWFLHADSCPSAHAIKKIRDHITAGNNSGYFQFRFDGTRHWYKRGLEIAINLRARLGIPYGDQGLFVEKATYANVGGHAALPLFEEVALIKHLRRQHNCNAVAGTIGVSSRRWERDGWLRRSLHNRYLAAAFALGIAPERLARQYGHRPMATNDTDSK